MKYNSFKIEQIDVNAIINALDNERLRYEKRIADGDTYLRTGLENYSDLSEKLKRYEQFDWDVRVIEK